MRHPNPFDLDRFTAQEPVANWIASHTATCNQCLAYLDAIKEQHENLLQAASPRTFAIVLGERISQTKAQKRYIWQLGIAATALVAVLLMVGIQVWTIDNERESSVRWRGDQAVVNTYIYRDGETSRWPGPSHPVLPGDRLRFEIIMPPNTKGYAALIVQQGERFTPVVPNASEAAVLPVFDQAWLPIAVEIEKDGSSMELLVVVHPQPFVLENLTNIAQFLSIAARIPIHPTQ